MREYKIWVINTLSITVLILVVIAVFNFCVDPYGYYRFSTGMFNYQKSKFSDPYQFKAYQLKEDDPEAIVLGTSRAMRLNPPRIRALSGETAYNLGLSGSSPYIELKYLEYAIKVDKNLKTVYLGLDFEVFDKKYLNHASFDERRLRSSFYLQDMFLTLLSSTTMKESLHVLQDNIRRTTQYTENRYLPDGSFDETLNFPKDNNRSTLQMISTTFSLSTASMDDINKVREICDQNHLKLYVYISPVHAILLETFWQSNLWGEYENWKRKLVEIMPVWDFSGYHEISMSSLQNHENYNNLSHFSKKVGDFILFRMLNKETDKVPNYFGVLLTKDNIEHHLEELRIDRNQWPDRDKNMYEIMPDNN
ncbi:hypothetical protein [Paenibacillus whitsoniae]|uniref:Uncharacterized protein n=1 Tax=Paenibacillus whitsoniae TaxID=2496558 RepID=A0A3S0CT70_9BACL|nr:hypothetical protein [Paenibacillus whitsoniae]RTE08146.1 hypothetical protein EJQ19_18835 [Paenibacillus whitsoniae]